ncbi:hypothetical protein B0T14DRAFT_567149 [Immersiella caudata]|uniref:Uncharacterized protein n=1 Tax=Immersiella caudata TaxID=314043 RepID=A0AA39WRW6_9PEZI|nr:hypothetical protein B0T14DRAFT_567149 [Immersiella caudata]
MPSSALNCPSPQNPFTYMPVRLTNPPPRRPRDRFKSLARLEPAPPLKEDVFKILDDWC